MAIKTKTIFLNIYPPDSIFKTRGYETKWEAEEEAEQRSHYPRYAAIKVAEPFLFEYEEKE